MSHIDTSATYSFRQAYGQTALTVLGCLAFVVIGLVTAQKLGPSQDGRAVMAYLPVLFFGLLMIGILWRVISLRGTVLRMSPEGIHDIRLASGTIPWRAIEDVFTWTHRGQCVVVLQVSPEVENQLGLSRIARVTRGANAALGADGLCITSAGLNLSHDDLLALIAAYTAADHGKSDVWLISNG
ncbi:hypothetical protein SAMN05880561_101893 [Rhizobium sp. RU33A]|uniref:STM3941 family protein n=1 Tax=Rhizobium sp. RU33A TaxID=1907413 RepID=UPI000954021A|nr:STM3941 family protein [Rhizobium sp. RU33A]SIQ03460.1 hypothetical protein SAMN05880561_101893 [Rhizobium sp. RU33A]